MKKKGLIIPIAIVFSLVAVILLQIQKEDLKGSFVESPEIEETKLNESEQKNEDLIFDDLAEDYAYSIVLDSATFWCKNSITHFCLLSLP